MTLAGFDPGYFLPEWKGALNGRIATTGATRNDRRMDIVVDAQQLGGKLRGRAIAGRAKVELRTAATASMLPSACHCSVLLLARICHGPCRLAVPLGGKPRAAE